MEQLKMMKNVSGVNRNESFELGWDLGTMETTTDFLQILKFSSGNSFWIVIIRINTKKKEVSYMFIARIVLCVHTSQLSEMEKRDIF